MYNQSEILKQFGRNVKAERIRKGYSQETQNMSLAKITSLANYLETDIQSLLKF